ncbi:radical SAM protein [Oscillibacter sp. GMB15532]|uniref:radical SAM protein n=1 Tax=Oscillibacter sp. GMB15532 TaxID=3230022 RepID=UPI0034E02CD6
MTQSKRLINFVLPVTACNFQCHYCYIGQEHGNTGELGTLDYSPAHIQKALTRERLGGVCHINMCGLGETLLAPYAVELAERMLENGHIVSIVTNGTVRKRIEELCLLPALLRERLFFKFSFHFLELRKRALLDAFFDNVQYVKGSGCALTVELTVNDQTVPFIPEVQEICFQKMGVPCHVIESRNNLDGFSRLTALPVAEHQRQWGTFHSPLFDFQQTQWMAQRREFCYAGEWVVSLNAGSGWIMPCFAGGSALQNIYENVDEPIRFAAIGTNCPWKHCYAAYILLSSGIVPELEAPCYADLRDRTCADGSTWLTPTVRDAFGGKFSEVNQPYSQEKRCYLDALMALEYAPNEPETQKKAARASKAVEIRLLDRGVKTVAVCANRADPPCAWLLSLLAPTKIRVRYILDSEYVENEDAGSLKNHLKRRCKYFLKLLMGQTPPVVNRYDRVPKVDAVVVAEYPQLCSVKRRIASCGFARVLALTELAD